MVVLAWAWGFVWLAIASLVLWPWVNGWLADPAAAEWRLMRWPLTVALGLGLLSLWMLAVGFWQLNVWLILFFPALLLVLAVWRAIRQPPPVRLWFDESFQFLKQFSKSLLQGNPASWVLLVGLALLVAVLGQSTYYPFLGDDEISRYAYYARLMFVQGHISSEVRGYPMFLPMAYAYIFFVTGQIAEQLARVIPALLSAMTVLASGALAVRWFGRRAGWAAALSLMISPLYLRWSPDGYIDIPSALYFVLCAYAGHVWQAKRQVRWAILAGLLAGLAMWTKQAGFAALACLGAVMGWALLQDLLKRKSLQAGQVVRDGLIALGVVFVVAGLWYLRNAYYDGWAEAVPGPGIFYFRQAKTDWAYLIPFIGFFDVFGPVASVLYMAGLVWAVVRFKRAALALLWTVPYTLLWFRLFSYDARFMLTVLPFNAILFGGLVSEWRWPSPVWLRWGAVAGVLVAMLAGVSNSGLGGIRRWVTDPNASYADRLNRTKEGLYPTVEYLQDHVPASARIISMDGRIKYYLIDRTIDVGYPTTLAQVRQYDYFVVGSWWSSTYNGLGSGDNEVTRAFENDPKDLEPLFYSPSYGLVVYRVVKP